MRNFDECDMEEFGRRLESSDKTIAVVLLIDDRLWLHTAKQGGERIMRMQFICSIWKKRNERPYVGGVSIRSRNAALSRKGCLVKGQSNY